MIALVTYAMQHITRGTLSGNGRFGPYGLILAAEGLLRFVPVMLLYIAGIDDILWYGLALAMPPALAAVISLRGQRDLLAPGPEAEWSELSTNLTLLFLGSLTAETLSYSAALGAILLAKGPVERAEAADFIVGFFIARIPILLFQAIQAALLPKLAALAGSGKSQRLPRRDQEAPRDRPRRRSARRRRRRDHRPVRRRDPVRREVQPRQRRPRPARRGQCALHPRSHARAGA